MTDSINLAATASAAAAAASQPFPGARLPPPETIVAPCGTPHDLVLPPDNPAPASAAAPSTDTDPPLARDNAFAAEYHQALSAADPYLAAMELDLTDPSLYDSAQPLRIRIWRLFCAGQSRSAIARALHIDRETVTRHIRAVDALLVGAQNSLLARERLRAIEAQHAVQAAAWQTYRDETARESQAFSQRDHNGAPTTRYRAQRARLLTIAGAAARNAARLAGLYDRPARTTSPDPPDRA